MKPSRLLSLAAAGFALCLLQGCSKPKVPAAPAALGAFQSVPSAATNNTFAAASNTSKYPKTSANEDGLPNQDSVRRPEISGDRSDHAVLLVHGLAMDGTGMMAIQAYLTSQGVPNVHTIDLPSRGLSSTMEECAGAVAQFVSSLASQGITKVDLVGHSMGGLVIREYVRSRQDNSVAVPTLITVATPNHGNGTVASLLEKIGAKSTISQMAANSDFIARINGSQLPSGTVGYGLRTPNDDVVRPSESCVLPGAQNYSLNVGSLGAHIAMAIHPDSLGLIHKLLTEEAPAPNA